MTAAKVTPLRQPSRAARMMATFPASNRSHAYFDPGSERLENGKVKVDYHNVKIAISEQLWERHLSGDRPLVLGLACDDGLTSVTAVDVDDYTIQALPLVAKAEKLKLPLFVNLSKSGGPHVFAFHEPITINESHRIGQGIARLLGLADEKLEYFPRPQSDTRKQALGLNMPFLGGESGKRSSFFKRTGAEMTPDEFVRCVQFLTAEQRAELFDAGSTKKKGKKKTKTKFETGPLPKERGRGYGTFMLKRYAAELENSLPGQRNNLLNKHAYQLGTMIAAGWVEREDVENMLKLAVRAWSDQPKTIDTLTRSLEAGAQTPHTPLPESGSMTEDNVALEFVERHADILRYDCEVKKWHEWIGSHWKRLKGQRVLDAVRKLVRELAAEGSPRFVSRVAFCRAVEKFAQSDQDFGIEVTHDIWDQDPMLLGTPGGTVDLQSGVLRDSVPNEHISTITAVAPSAEANCPLWLDFLKQTTKDNPELVRFLQRLYGYALIGDNREHLLVFLHGTGGNGKGVFIETIGNVVGDYRQEGATDLLTETMFSKHTTDLAMLSEARLVTATETSSDKYWDEVRVKQLTGGNKVTARKMHQDNITHVPKYLPTVIGNYKPRLRNVDDAMMRRLYIIPFTNQVKKEDADVDLPEKLKAEYPAILRWLIDGCLMYQREKFKDIPASVKATTKEYFQGEDIYGRWLEYDIELGSDTDSLSAIECFSMWKDFAQQAGESPGTQNQSTTRLKAKFQGVTRRGLTHFKGIRRRRVDPGESSTGEMFEHDGVTRKTESRKP